jgi:hypothetical protein
MTMSCSETLTEIQETMQGKDRWIYPWSTSNMRSSQIYKLNYQCINPQVELVVKSLQKY